MAEREDELIPIAQRANATMAALTVDGAQPLDDALVALPKTLRELEATAPIATDLVDRLDRLAVAVTPALPDLTLAARDAVPVLEDAIPVLIRATPMIEDARQLATRLGKANEGLVEMFDLLPPTLSKFDEALEVITMITAHGAPAYRQLLAAFVGFDGIFSGYQTQDQNPAAPGHALRISTYFTDGLPDGPAAASRVNRSRRASRTGCRTSRAPTCEGFPRRRPASSRKAGSVHVIGFFRQHREPSGRDSAARSGASSTRSSRWAGFRTRARRS